LKTRRNQMLLPMWVCFTVFLLVNWLSQFAEASMAWCSWCLETGFLLHVIYVQGLMKTFLYWFFGGKAKYHNSKQSSFPPYCT
jgi:hypothetical protein